MGELRTFEKVRGFTRLEDGVTAPAGFQGAATSAGVKLGLNRPDLAVIVADEPCVAQGLFTRSRVVAAPVILSRERLIDGRAQGIVINSGNANACTGPVGMEAARAMADGAARHLKIDPDLMLVASTGVIGVPLPIERVLLGIRDLQPSKAGGHAAARAIMTTDRVAKEIALVGQIDGRRVLVGGMAKGSGMIHPQMATMLAVLTTDAALEPTFARQVLKRVGDATFNQVSVDRDTSTNDSLVLFASGAAGGPPITAGSRSSAQFTALLESASVALTRMIAQDGEGASRLIEVVVEGARSSAAARRVAREVVASNLVKTAVFGRDPNWGRIMMAMGNAGVPLDPDRVEIHIGDQQVARDGAPCPFDAAAVADLLGADEVQIRIGLNQGGSRGLAWGCDLTEEYVKINAEYTT
ncbi:MAG TPA: bifunctional glutamate N-acetyltransferase/amino-acid acetyltransferase ArgJ [Chloroflexota bacterium]